MRIHLRDLLWLTVVVALLAGWLVDRRRQLADQARINGDLNVLILRLEVIPTLEEVLDI